MYLKQLTSGAFSTYFDLGLAKTRTLYEQLGCTYRSGILNKSLYSGNTMLCFVLPFNIEKNDPFGHSVTLVSPLIGNPPVTITLSCASKKQEKSMIK